MTEYTEAFCEVDGYRCLMPVEYELIEEDLRKKIYRKVACNCYNVKSGKCNRGKICNHFLAAKEIIEE